MTTPPPTPVMTLDETEAETHRRIEALRKKADAHLSISDLNYRQGVNGYAAAQRLEADKALKEVSFLESSLHHLDTGKRLREAVENLRDQKGRYNTGAAYDKLMALLSPQPSQQPSPPAPYYTADGKPLQYHEVSGGGGCGAIPVEPPKQSPQT